MSIEGKVYRDEVIRVVDLFTTSDVLAGYSFTNCLIFGPAVISLAGNGFFVNNSLIVPDIYGVLWYPPTGNPVMGAIQFADTTFEGCRFERIGFVGDEAFQSKFLAAHGVS